MEFSKKKKKKMPISPVSILSKCNDPRIFRQVVWWTHFQFLSLKGINSTEFQLISLDNIQINFLLNSVNIFLCYFLHYHYRYHKRNLYYKKKSQTRKMVISIHAIAKSNQRERIYENKSQDYFYFNIFCLVNLGNGLTKSIFFIFFIYNDIDTRRSCTKKVQPL